MFATPTEPNHNITDKVKGAAQTVADTVKGATETVKGAAQSVVNSIKGMSHDAAEKNHEAMDRMKGISQDVAEKMRRTGYKAADKGDEAAENVKDKGHEAADKVRSAAEQAADKVRGAAWQSGSNTSGTVRRMATYTGSSDKTVRGTGGHKNEHVPGEQGIGDLDGMPGAPDLGTDMDVRGDMDKMKAGAKQPGVHHTKKGRGSAKDHEGAPGDMIEGEVGTLKGYAMGAAIPEGHAGKAVAKNINHQEEEDLRKMAHKGVKSPGEADQTSPSASSSPGSPRQPGQQGAFGTQDHMETAP